MLHTEEMNGDRKCSKSKPNDRRKHAGTGGTEKKSSVPAQSKLVAAQKSHRNKTDEEIDAQSSDATDRAGRLSPTHLEELLKEITTFREPKVSSPLAKQLLSQFQSQDESNSSGGVYVNNNSIKNQSTQHIRAQSEVSSPTVDDANNNRNQTPAVVANGARNESHNHSPNVAKTGSNGSLSEEPTENGTMRIMGPVRNIGTSEGRQSRMGNCETRNEDEPMITASGSLVDELRSGMPAGIDSRSNRGGKKKDVGVRKSYMASSVQGNVGDKPIDELCRMFGEKPKSNKTSRGRTKTKLAMANSTIASSSRSEEGSPSPTVALSPERRALSPQSERGGSPADRSHLVENRCQSDPDIDEWEKVTTRKSKKQKKPPAPLVSQTFPTERPKERSYSSHAMREAAPTKRNGTVTAKVAANPDEEFPPIDGLVPQMAWPEAKPMQLKMSDVLKGKKAQPPPVSSQQAPSKPKTPPVKPAPVIMDSCRILQSDFDNDKDLPEGDGFYFGLDFQTIRSIRATARIHCVTSKKDEDALRDRFNYGQCVKLLSDNWSEFAMKGNIIAPLYIP